MIVSVLLLMLLLLLRRWRWRWWQRLLFYNIVQSIDASPVICWSHARHRQAQAQIYTSPHNKSNCPSVMLVCGSRNEHKTQTHSGNRIRFLCAIIILGSLSLSLCLSARSIGISIEIINFLSISLLLKMKLINFCVHVQYRVQ